MKVIDKKRISNVKLASVSLIVFGLAIIVSGFVGAQATNTVCCSQTNSGAFCQNVPENECAPGAEAVPTACESTSYCKPGTCFDSNEGICLDNTPQLVCNDNGGVWEAVSPSQCDLGCCVLGDQAAFVSLVRCKKLAGELGLETNYDSSVGSEFECVASVQNQDRGACVYEFEFEKTCDFTTRAECEGIGGGEEGVAKGEFFKDKLCSAEELGTNCGPSTKTTCSNGRDEVYFTDTCGNPANIYDSSKVNDQEYWTNVKGKEESCGFGNGNAGSAGCGNCEYLLGSICRDDNIASGNPSYGDFICADLNCKSTSTGQSYRHGESWCVNNDQGSTGEGDNSVGSRFYKHICINGEEVVEACGDYRAEECIQGEINSFSQAACRVNRWQDCIAQVEQIDCENEDRRDCIWKEGVLLSNSTAEGSCLPQNPPGLNFWEGGEGESICSQANTLCVVTYEEGIFGGRECVENCECLTEKWEQDKSEVCRALGDCGPGENWVGKKGNKEGFKIVVGDVEQEEG